MPIREPELFEEPKFLFKFPVFVYIGKWHVLSLVDVRYDRIPRRDSGGKSQRAKEPRYGEQFKIIADNQMIVRCFGVTKVANRLGLSVKPTIFTRLILDAFLQKV